MSSVIVSSNLLPLKSPYRLHGALQLVYVGAIVAMTALVLPEIWTRLTMAVELFRTQAGTGTEPSDTQIVEIMRAMFNAFGILVVVWVVLRHALSGLHRLFAFFVPAGIPGHLANPQHTANMLFTHRMFGHFEERPALLQKVLVRLFPRLAYLAAPGIRLLHSITEIKSFVICAIAIVAVLFIDQRATAILALPVLIAAVKVVSAVALLTLATRQPVLDVKEERHHLSNTGNPANFQHHIDNIAHEVRYQEFPNRYYVRAEPEIVDVQPGVTSKFAGQLLFETQPLPMPRRLPTAAVFLAVTGMALGFVSIGALLYLPAWTWEGIAPAWALPLIVGIVFALFISGRLWRRALDLIEVFRFESFLFSIDLKGTYASSSIGLGDGRGGQLYSERRTIQSDTYVHAFGTRVITECSGANALRAERYVVDTQTNEDFFAAYKQLIDGLPNFKDSTRELPSIDLESPHLAAQLNVNLRIAEETARAQARAHAGLPGPSQPQFALSSEGEALRLTDGADVSPAGGDFKTCPECGESVRSAARKCRFCDYRFEAAAG